MEHLFKRTPLSEALLLLVEHFREIERNAISSEL